MEPGYRLMKILVGGVSAVIAAELACIGANAAIDDAMIIKERLGDSLEMYQKYQKMTGKKKGGKKK